MMMVNDAHPARGTDSRHLQVPLPLIRPSPGTWRRTNAAKPATFLPPHNPGALEASLVKGGDTEGPRPGQAPARCDSMKSAQENECVG